MIEAKIKALLSKVGTPYKKLFDDGNYCGCFMPVYEVYDFLPKYPLPPNEEDTKEYKAILWEYGHAIIKTHAFKIDKSEVQAGDVLVTHFRGELHVALCLGGGKIAHVFKDHTLEITRIQHYFKDKNIRYFRVK